MSSSSPSSSSIKQEQDQQKTTTTTSTSTDSKLGEKLDLLVKKYLQYEKLEQHKQYIETLVRSNDREQLQRLVGQRLKFGTAGIRGSMGAGFNQMNDLVIIQTSQGMASYLLEVNESGVREKGVIIGHDARHNSNRFARLAALAFLEKRIPVYFCDHIIPTPLIAFGVKHFNCFAGIMITASHNPKNDNGYKVYWTNGAQILPPHDKGIQDHILNDSNQQPWPKAWQHELLMYGGSSSCSRESNLPKEWDQLFMRVHGDLSKNYFAYIESLVSDRRTRNQMANICITYTSMHGVGHMFLSRALDLAGFEEVFPVELQKKPDPEFSTVKFPNPEESGALDLAFETAKHANSNLILAVDPDADRCAAALYDPKTHYKRLLTGNEIGALLGWWSWHCYLTETLSVEDGEGEEGSSLDITTSPVVQVDSVAATAAAMPELQHRQQQQKACPSDCYMISTAVSSKFLQSMSRIEGFQFVETLTGFKYMGNLAHKLLNERPQVNVLFAYEEAIGYMVDSSILDKDGISACVQLAQCAAFVKSNFGRTLEQQLDWLYQVYGYHFNLNSYYLCTEVSIIGEIFTNLQSNYPTNFGPKFKVTRVRDLNNGFDSGEANKKATLPISSSSYMLTFFVNNNITFTLRTSGTEPKIKYYSEIVVPPLPQLSDAPGGGGGLLSGGAEQELNNEAQLRVKDEARAELQQLVQLAIETCLRPNQYEQLEAAD